jgi:hypothetical protein
MIELLFLIFIVVPFVCWVIGIAFDILAAPFKKGKR